MKEIRLPRSPSPKSAGEQNVRTVLRRAERRRLLGIHETEPSRFQRVADWACRHGYGIWMGALATTLLVAVAMGRC